MTYLFKNNMTYSVAITGIIAFVVGNVLLEKGKFQRLLGLGMIKLILLSLPVLLLSVLLGIVTKLILIPAVATILVATLINKKYRNVFEKMEAGKINV